MILRRHPHLGRPSGLRGEAATARQLARGSIGIVGVCVPALCALLAALTVISEARAETSSPPPSSNETATADNERLFGQANQALKSGAPERAIALLELLADRDFRHPDASFNRAVAYARRGNSDRRRPGDLGKAAASLEETLVLRPSDEIARLTLSQVREEIARRSMHEGQQVHTASPSPGRALAGLLSENAWGSLALLGSMALALGLALRWWTQHSTRRLAGMVASIAGAILLLIGASAAAASRHYRETTTNAVVITEGARLLDAEGKAQPRSGKARLDRLPEGALLHLIQRHGSLLEVEWGSLQGFVDASQVRILPRAE